MVRCSRLLFAISILFACSSEPPSATPDVGVEDQTATQPDLVDDSQIPDGEFGPRTRVGKFWAGDFHVHATGASNDAAPGSTPERIREVAMQVGLDFVVLTDHSNSTGSDPSTLEEDPALYNQGPEFPYWERAAQLSDDQFLMIDGNEISPVEVEGRGPTGHVGCIPIDLDTFDPNVAFVDRPRGTVPGSMAIEQANDVGCFSILNHPFGPVPWVMFDWSSFDYNAIEVYNGGLGFFNYDYSAMLAWACDLSQGRDVIAVGGSDNHNIDIEAPGSQLDPPIGIPITWVWAEELDWSQLMRSLQAGHASVSDGDEPFVLDVYDGQRRWLGMQGDSIDAGQPVTLRFRGSLSEHMRRTRLLRIFEIEPGACIDTRADDRSVPDPQLRILYEAELTSHEAFDVHMEYQPTPGHFVFATVYPERFVGITHGGGLTNAVRFH